MKSTASKFCGGALAVMLALLGLAAQIFFAFLVLLIPVNVLAVSEGDTVVPSNYATSLKPGGSVTITKTVTIRAGTPTSAKVDVFFLADTTGSMGGALQNVKNGAAAIMTGLSTLGDVAYGVGEYKDYGSVPPDPFVYRLNQDITTNTAAVQTGIEAWLASGGDDWEEGQLYALKQVADTVSWRDGSTRILIWFGDAPGHDPAGPSPEVTETEAIAALVAYQVPEGTPVLATADGKLYKVQNAAGDPVNGAGYAVYHNSYIDHGNGYKSWYLYASLTPAIQAQTDDPAKGYAQVTKGQIIGNTIGDHLHFEVRYNGIDHSNVVDPYKLGLWLPTKTGHVEALILLLLDDTPAP